MSSLEERAHSLEKTAEMLDFEDGRVKTIRDFRYVPYIAAEAELESVR